MYGDRISDADSHGLRFIGRDQYIMPLAEVALTHKGFMGKPPFEAFRDDRVPEEAARDAYWGGLVEALGAVDILEITAEDDHVTVRPKLNLLETLQKLTYSEAWKFIRKYRGQQVPAEGAKALSPTSSGVRINRVSAHTPDALDPTRAGNDIMALAATRSEALVEILRDEGIFRKPIDEQIFRRLWDGEKQKDIGDAVSMKEPGVSKRVTGIMTRIQRSRQEIVARLIQETES